RKMLTPLTTTPWTSPSAVVTTADRIVSCRIMRALSSVGGPCRVGPRRACHPVHRASFRWTELDSAGQNRPVDSAVAKAFGLLEALAQAKGPSRLSTLATELGLQKSTVHRVLAELIGLGYVERDEATGLYRPTLRTWEIGTAIVADLPIKQVAS